MKIKKNQLKRAVRSKTALIADQYMDPNVRPNIQGGGLEDISFSAPTPDIPRAFKTCFEPDFLESYHKGTMNYCYKGIPCLKDPIDLALYIKLIWELKPATIIEIGSFHGGSAIFYKDLCETYKLSTSVITVDFRAIQGHDDPRVNFIQADALHLDQSQLDVELLSCPRPWLVIEDSAHTGEVTLAVIKYFSQKMMRGDVLIVEDGVIEDQGANSTYRGGPNFGVNRFFSDHPKEFRVMTEYTDFFGRNATFNPNGYLEKL